MYVDSGLVESIKKLSFEVLHGTAFTLHTGLSINISVFKL